MKSIPNTKTIADPKNTANTESTANTENTANPKSIATDAGVKKVQTAKVSASGSELCVDTVSVEEPLEIRIGFDQLGEGQLDPGLSRLFAPAESFRQIAVTMRTPGSDEELAAGFLFTEGIISSRDDIANMTSSNKCNAVTVRLKEHVQVDPAVFLRHSFVASSCGICGKKSIAAVTVKRQYRCFHDEPVVAAEIIYNLPKLLRQHQDNFEHTGGIHASCLFELDGKLVSIREDVGRHNALDKLLGAQLLAGALPLTGKILMLSGRASFELIQKAAHAGLAIIAAVGAPSSLAVQLAEECDVTLLGFVRDERFNIYSGAHRIKCQQN